MNLTQLITRFAEKGVRKLYAKPLSENDNSKNQIYFAGAVELLNVFPSQQIMAENSGSKGPTFKAALHFGWLLENGEIAHAPGAQLIFYPQYPEVRFSGFLRGCAAGPGKLMADRERARSFEPEIRAQLKGRVLFLGVTGNDRIIGYVAPGNSELARETSAAQFPTAFVVFHEIPLPTVTDAATCRIQLLAELRRINQLGWIDSKQLHSDGHLRTCQAPQCGGFTLEAELGIPKNSTAEPDYLGWEVKQHAVTNFQRPDTGGAITLMTPEPTNGIYKEQGAAEFIRRFGYADKKGVPDRFNFGGVHRVGAHQNLTGLKMELVGYDAVNERIVDANGYIALISEKDEVAAAWAFSGLLSHWSRKHSLAVYVPSMKRITESWQYCYGHRVRLAQRTDPLKFLNALATGTVYYDPGIKLENASTKPLVKKRSQFRIASKNISALYETLEYIDL